jgi:hypothetical protein
MPLFRVYEKQTILYSWVVKAADLDEALGAADAGVPDGANTEKFHSDNDVEPVDTPRENEDVYDPTGRIVDEDEGYTDVVVDDVVIASTRHVDLTGS